MKAAYRLTLERDGKEDIEVTGIVRGSVLATLFGRAFRLARDAMVGKQVFFHRWNRITLELFRR